MRGRSGRISAVLLAAAALAAGCGGGDGGDDRPERVSLALDFAPNAVHAGVFAAVRERHDRARGLALQIRAPSGSTDSLKLLTSRRADVAIVDIHDLGLARERGEDLVGIGALVQRPLAAVIARASVRRPRDLGGSRVGVAGLPSDDAVLRAVVEHDGGDFDRVRRVTIGFSAVPNLVAGKVDAATAFWNAEGVTLRRRGVRTREFRVDDFGAPRYPELVLVARRETVEDRAGTLERVLGALREGTEAALDDRPAAASEIADASHADEALVRAQLNAVAPALRPAIRLDPASLEGWARFDERFGILERRPEVRRAFALDLRPAR